MRPMLASPGRSIPTGPAWVHEVKWDGMRVLADVRPDRVRLSARSGADATVRFPELCGPGGLEGVYEDLLLDGEVVALRDGRPSFGALAERMHVSDPSVARALAATLPVTYVVFDVVRVLGQDVTGLPLRDRRALLEQLDLAGPHVQVPPTYPDGGALHAATLDQGLEGIVSKALDSPYRPGTRSSEWLKFPHRQQRSVVVGGWRTETGSASRLGAVLVGAPVGGGLAYLGRVGSGLAGRAGETLLADLSGLACDTSSFVDEVPREDAAGARWVRPELVIGVRSLGLGAGGRLRQSSYVGTRLDLAPGDLEP